MNEVTGLKKTLVKLLSIVKSDEDLWDTSDVIRNWKVSVRTLASWRSKGMIGYIKIGGKIWYPKIAREKFLLKNMVENDCLRKSDSDRPKLIYPAQYQWRKES